MPRWLTMSQWKRRRLTGLQKVYRTRLGLGACRMPDCISLKSKKCRRREFSRRQGLAHKCVGTLSALRSSRYLASIVSSAPAAMAQNDFGRAFTASENSPRVSEHHLEVVSGVVAKNGPGRDHVTNASPRSVWVNTMFATITLVAGLFCAFYFFNASEIWQGAVGWAGDLLCPRQAAVLVTVEDNQGAEVGSGSDQETPTTMDRSGDPFARASGFLSLTSPSAVRHSGGGASLPVPPRGWLTESPFAQLGFPAPGADGDRKSVQHQGILSSAAEGIAPESVTGSGADIPSNSAQQQASSLPPGSPSANSSRKTALGRIPASLGGRH
jgi:hypothetical protein